MATLKRLVLFCIIVLAAVVSRPSTASAGLCFFCGGNAATVGDGVLFDRLNVKRDVRLPGKPWLYQAEIPRYGPVDLAVSGDRLAAIDSKGVPHVDGDLIHLRLIVKTDDRSAYAIRLIDFVLTRFWVGRKNEPPSLPSYLFVVWKCGPNGEECGQDGPSQEEGPREKEALPVCRTQPQEETAALGPEYKLAMTFAGDRFMPDHSVVKEPSVVKGPKEGWFNFACYGTAAAKMHLLRHTQAGSIPGFETTLDQRTAMLRAITADYLSDDRSWTGDGTPLYWTDQRQWFPLQQQGYSTIKGSTKPRLSSGLVRASLRKNRVMDVEAAWGDRGQLLCLNTPRRAPGPIVHSTTCTNPAVVRSDVIQARQKEGLSVVPTCDALVGKNPSVNPWSASPLLAGAYVVTVNRPKAANYCGTLVGP